MSFLILKVVEEAFEEESVTEEPSKLVEEEPAEVSHLM